MTNNHALKTTSRAVAALALLSVSVAGLTPMAYAFNSSAPAGAADARNCEFSVQLQKSVAERRQYLTKVVALTGKVVAKGNAVEEMYANVEKASYSVGGSVLSDELAEEQPDFWDRGTRKTVRAVGLDGLSTDCLGCHDGVSASSVSVDLRNSPFRRGSLVSSFSSDHPVGMDYSRYVGSSRGGYKPVGFSSTKMIFVDGKVGCLTCHDPLNPEKGHLVMSDKHSALCLTCHNK
jgi:predicted CXXCH cytochrome family protein